MGQDLNQRVCTTCGTVNDLEDQFCANCGNPLVGGPTTLLSVASQPGQGKGRRITGSLATGNILGGRYRIVQLVGKGGFGAVYKANDERFQGRRVVAVKEMSDANLSPKDRVDAVQHFRQEADLLVQLNHPNLPTVSDFFEEEDKAYLVMAFVEGLTLEKIQVDTKGPLDEVLVMGWALQLCDVLHYLHTLPQPIIFRDMKPSNVMVTKDTQIKLIDFGIARFFKSTAMTDTRLLGSQGFAPLEQYGQAQSDPRSDIYALGATLYLLLTNRPPLDAPSRRIYPQTFLAPRQINPNISPGTEAIILRAMGQDPQDRFQSAVEMGAAIIASGIIQTSASRLPNSGPFAPARFSQPLGANSLPLGGPATWSQTSGMSSSVTPPLIGQPTGPTVPAPGQGITRRRVLIGGAVAAAAVTLGGAGLFFANRNKDLKGGLLPLGPTGPITVMFTYSTEKADWLKAVIETFNSNKPMVDGRLIQVAPDPRGSGDAKDKILNGVIRPTIWSPASSLELSQLSATWQQVHPGKNIFGSGDLLPRSLVSSPLVFAIWETRAKILLKKYKMIDWPVIHDALVLKNGWADIGGDPAWGVVKFGQTRPDKSNSGLLAITLLAYSFFKQQRSLQVSQVQDPAFLRYLGDIQGAVNAFGQSSGTFMKNIVLPQGPAAYDITATYENLVLTLEDQAKKLQGQILQLFYPSLNIESDHPFAILHGDWVKNEEQKAAIIFRDYLLADAQQRLALVSGFRPSNPNVALTENIPGNAFARQVATLQIQPRIQPLAQTPSGTVVDELIKQWKANFSDAPTTPGG